MLLKLFGSIFDKRKLKNIIENSKFKIQSVNKIRVIRIRIDHFDFLKILK